MADPTSPMSSDQRPRNASIPAERTGTIPWLQVGIALDLAGFGLIAVAWAAVAGTSQVADQLPALVLGGIGGLALVVVGLAIVDMQAMQRDRHERDHQLRVLAELLDRLDARSTTTESAP